MHDVCVGTGSAWSGPAAVVQVVRLPLVRNEQVSPLGARSAIVENVETACLCDLEPWRELLEPADARPAVAWNEEPIARREWIGLVALVVPLRGVARTGGRFVTLAVTGPRPHQRRDPTIRRMPPSNDRIVVRLVLRSCHELSSTSVRKRAIARIASCGKAEICSDKMTLRHGRSEC